MDDLFLEGSHQEVDIFIWKAKVFGQNTVGNAALVDVYAMANTQIGSAHFLYPSDFPHF